MEKKINIPKKGAGRKWAQRLKELGMQPPPPELMAKLNEAYKDRTLLNSLIRKISRLTSDIKYFICKKLCACPYCDFKE